MDGWGSLTMLIKRQEADKRRKAELRYKLQKRKEAFFEGDYLEDEFNFPELSSNQMEK